MTVDSNAQCEVRKSNIVQKAQIFYKHNKVTNYNPKQKKRMAEGKVLIIVNEFVENRFHDVPEDIKPYILKKLYKRNMIFL